MRRGAWGSGVLRPGSVLDVRRIIVRVVPQTGRRATAYLLNVTAPDNYTLPSVDGRRSRSDEGERGDRLVQGSWTPSGDRTHCLRALVGLREVWWQGHPPSPKCQGLLTSRGTGTEGPSSANWGTSGLPRKTQKSCKESSFRLSKLHRIPCSGSHLCLYSPPHRFPTTRTGGRSRTSPTSGPAGEGPTEWSGLGHRVKGTGVSPQGFLWRCFGGMAEREIASLI